MKKLISLLLLAPLSLFWEMPVKASPESCLNQLSGIDKIQYRSPHDRIEHRATIEHEGLTYYWIDLYPSGQKGSLETVISEDWNGDCHAVLADYGSNYETLEQYERTLGKQVLDKFMQVFRENS